MKQNPDDSTNTLPIFITDLDENQPSSVPFYVSRITAEELMSMSLEEIEALAATWKDHVD